MGDTMRKIVSLGLVGAILATMLVAVLPVFENRPVMAMSGNGTAGNPFMITDVDDLQAMANNLTAHYKLANDIDASLEWSNIVQVAESFNGHNSGLKSDGTVVAVGDNTHGQCNVGNWTDIVQLATISGGHTVGLQSDGFVVAVGDNTYGECDVGAWGSVAYVSATSTHTVGLKWDATVLATGDNGEGQCNVGGWTGIAHVIARSYRTTGLRSDGTVVATGWNLYGQCDVGAWTDITQIAVGFGHTVGLKSDGTVVAVGDNTYGQCNVSTWAGIIQVVAGNNHTVGLKSDGTAVAVGDNSKNQRNVSGWANLTHLRATQWQTFGLKSDGTVVAVGRNTEGQCNVTGWTDIVYIGGTGWYTVGLKANGRVVATGSDHWGDAFAGFAPIGDSATPFTGVLDGDGHTISNLYMNRPTEYDVGLFGYARQSTVGNVNIAGCDITGYRYVGGLIGRAGATTVYNCSAAGNITGDRYLGGLIGQAHAYDSVGVTVSESWSSCDIAGDRYIGGLIGQAYYTDIDNSYARGACSGDTYIAGLVAQFAYGSLTKSYSTGAVSGTSSLGGLVAQSLTGAVITDSFWDRTTSGQSTSDGGTGRTTSYMTDIDLYKAAAWDIEHRWIYPPDYNDRYPILSWQIGNSPTWIIHGAPPDAYQVVHFQPNTIILGTTLPNRASGGAYPDGTFSWGDNPAGIEIRLDGFLTPEDVYRFEPIMPTGRDIIEPEPAGMTGDVDLGKLAKNPFRPMVQVIASGAGFTERLAWLLLAIFILIAIMIAVLLWTQHMVFTALAGFAVGFMFYSMGVWGLWVVILLAFGLVASLVYERMPTL